MAALLNEEVVDEIVFAVNMQELARLESVMQHCANVGVKTRVQLEFLPAAYTRIYLEKFREVRCLASPALRTASCGCSSSGYST